MSKQGSTVNGLLDSWATMFSIALQYGAPLEVLCEKGMGTHFEPRGFTGDRLRSATSPVDYISRWLLNHPAFAGANMDAPPSSAPSEPPANPSKPTTLQVQDDVTERARQAAEVLQGLTQAATDAAQSVRRSLTEGPPCSTRGCGGTTRRAGACYVCETCGSTSGCG